MLTLALMVGGLCAGAASAQHLRTSVASAGGHAAASGAYRLGGTLGQPVAGRTGTAATVGIGFWHQVVAFGGLSLPGVPALLAPADGAEGLPPAVELVWDAVPEAASYALQVATTADFVAPVIDEAEVAGTSFQVSGLAEATTYFWRVRAANAAGAGAFSGAFSFTTAPSVGVEDEAIPMAFALHAPYPNPTSARAALGFDLPKPARIRLTVYDALGREVAVLVEGERAAGQHEAVLADEELPAGLYFVRLRAGAFTQTRPLTVLR